MNIIEYANYIEQGLSHEEIAKKLGYTNEQMKRSLEKLGVVFDDDDFKESVFRKWTEEEEEFLVENHKKMNNKELGEVLGRTGDAVTQRKCKLGITNMSGNYRKWTKEEIDYLKENHGRLSEEELSIALERTHLSVRYKRYELGLLTPKKQSKKTYVAYKGDEKIGVGTLEELTKTTGYTWNTLYQRSVPSGRKLSGKRGLKVYELEEE